MSKTAGFVGMMVLFALMLASAFIGHKAYVHLAEGGVKYGILAAYVVLVLALGYALVSVAIPGFLKDMGWTK